MSTHYSLFGCELLRISKKFFESSNGAEVLSRIIPSDYSKFDNSITFKTKKKKDLISLTILHYYLPEELQFLVRLYLEEKKHIPEIATMLHSRSHMVLFLQEQFTGRSLFGNYFNEKEIKRIMNLLFLSKRSNRRPKRKIRHRGYRDKGTLRRIEDRHSFWESGSAQQEIEDNRQAYNDALEFIRGFIE